MSNDSPRSIDLDALQERIDRLEQENARLRGLDPTAVAPARRGRWRAVLSALCIALATVLVPVSIVGTWARVQLVDEARFVETFAPLAADPAVQALITDQVTAAIDDAIDLQGITDDLFDGLQELDLPPRASDAIQLLRIPAAQGLQSVVDTTVTRLVGSDAFETVWSTALIASHRALAAAASGGTADGALQIGENGEIGIQLGPIIEDVKQRLVDQGIGFAESIPVIDRTIVVAKSEALVTVSVVYNIAVTVGWWLPVIALALFGGGILLARRRTVAVLGSGVGMAIGGIVLAIGLSIGGTVAAILAAQLGISASALGAIYAQVVDAMHQTAVVVALLGVVVAILAWVQGRSRAAAATRTGTGTLNAAIRSALRSRGVNTGGFGRWMYAQRVLVRVVLAVVLFLWLLLLRPLGIGDLAMVVIVGLLAWWAAELVQLRPADASGPTADRSPAEEVAAAVEPDVAAEEHPATR